MGEERKKIFSEETVVSLLGKKIIIHSLDLRDRQADNESTTQIKYNVGIPLEFVPCLIHLGVEIITFFFSREVQK